MSHYIHITDGYCSDSHLCNLLCPHLRCFRNINQCWNIRSWRLWCQMKFVLQLYTWTREEESSGNSMNSYVDKDFISTFSVCLLWIKLSVLKHKWTAAGWQTSFREQFQLISAEVRWIKHVLFTNVCVCADAPVRTFSLSFHVREFLNSAEWISLFFVSRQHELWPHQLTAMIENFLNTNQFSPGNQLIHSDPADGNRICLVFI